MSTENLTYVSRHATMSVTIYDTLGRVPVYLVYEDRERLIEQIIDDLTEKQEVLFAYVLKRHQYTSHYLILSGELKKTMKAMS